MLLRIAQIFIEFMFFFFYFSCVCLVSDGCDDDAEDDGDEYDEEEDEEDDENGDVSLAEVSVAFLTGFLFFFKCY